MKKFAKEIRWIRKLLMKIFAQNGQKVVLKKIDRSLFTMPMNDPLQEELRQLILDALAEADEHLARYAKFWLVIPKKNWQYFATKKELKECARAQGGNIANWVEWALGFAQQISKAVDKTAAWEGICNKADPNDWFRVIVWKDDRHLKVVGGSQNTGTKCPAAKVHYRMTEKIGSTVPVVTIR